MRKVIHPDKFRAVIASAAVVGVLLATILLLLFGILDVQCRNSPLGTYWNAAQQVCQAAEV